MYSVKLTNYNKITYMYFSPLGSQEKWGYFWEGKVTEKSNNFDLLRSSEVKFKITNEIAIYDFLLESAYI